MDLGTDLAAMNDEQLSDALHALEAVEQTATAPDLGPAALWYAQTLLWPVFPLRPSDKAPLTQHGFKDSSNDREQIIAWWTRWPKANIGLPTGRTEQGGIGWDVIDIDGTAGFASLAGWKHADCPGDCSATDLCDATGDLPPIAFRAFTPGDPKGLGKGKRVRQPGRHYYTPAAGTGCGSDVLPGIDLRGDGGYVVAAPSLGPSGNRYSWLTPPQAA